MLEGVFKKFWDSVAKGDQKRIDSQVPTPGIKEIDDISYVADNLWEHKLDVYSKEDQKGKQPIIIDIHGGGWMYGTKEINKYYNFVLASRGYVIVSINYHLAPDSSIDVQLKDCFLALKWVKENIEKYNGDLNNVYITGDSAGGFLAAYSALLNSSDELRKVFDVVDTGLSFRACGLTSPVCYMNVKGITNVYFRSILGKDFKSGKLNGLENIDAVINKGKMTPTFFVTSSGDFVAQKPTIKAYNLFCEQNVECDLLNWDKFDGKDLQHVFSVVDPYSEPGIKTIDRMIEFFRKFEA